MSRKQCKLCPWKVRTNPNEIPNGYDREKHKGLANTIANPGDLSFGNTMRIMACHESPVGRELPCVGWLNNQLGEGNHIQLRLAVHQGQINAEYELDGEQHETFVDTLE